MSPYRYQDHSPADPSQSVKLRLAVSAADTAEWVWAEPIGGDHYRVLNVPFLTTEVGLHDVVLALDGADGLEFVMVVERRTFIRFDFALSDASHHTELTALIRRHGIAVENGGGELVANLPDRTAAPILRRFLERHASWFEQLDLVGATAGRT